MAGKRQATSDLNHDNWDREEEPEDRGTFRTANEDELKNRVIKKARRKIAPGTATADAADGGTATKSVFSGFSGFGKAPAATAAASPFSFLSKIPALGGAAASTTSGIVSSSTTTTSSTPTFSFGSGSATTVAKTTEPATTLSTFSFGSTATSSNTAAAKPPPASSTFSFSSSTKTIDSKEEKKDIGEGNTKSPEYYIKLKELNQAVSDWIKTHVDKNPMCILTPVFKDYENHLKELEKDTNVKATTASPTVSALSSTTTAPAAAPAKTNGFSFGLKKPEDTSIKPIAPAVTAAFSFGLKTTTTESSATSSSTSLATASKPFSFTPGGTPFSFGNIQPPAASSSTTTSAANEDEDEEPPKNEFKQVVEDDAVYSKKCKVFVKKDGNFVDKGVGTLYLKPIESSGKTQLIVRADTNLGNILVNLILNSAIPSQRMGKNNVMMVCVPTPEVEKPTSMLLRVKTAEEADELLENIDKYKK